MSLQHRIVFRAAMFTFVKLEIWALHPPWTKWTTHDDHDEHDDNHVDHDDGHVDHVDHVDHIDHVDFVDHDHESWVGGVGVPTLDQKDHPCN